MIRLTCMECDTKFSATLDEGEPECPTCGSHDYEVD